MWKKTKDKSRIEIRKKKENKKIKTAELKCLYLVCWKKWRNDEKRKGVMKGEK